MAQLPESEMAVAAAEWNGLFARVGSELRSLAGIVNDLQLFLAPLVGRVVESDPDALMRLQDLDLLEQSLHGLSDLMSCLDPSMAITDATALASGIKTIRLAGLAQRLQPAVAEPAGDGAPEASVLELF